MDRISESQWVNYFGFQRFPFDRPEAGNEEFARPEFLAACFVSPANFERILGQASAPVTSLLFAARGTGKTACRVYIDYLCQHGQAVMEIAPSDDPVYVLSVPHVHLDRVVLSARHTFPTDGFPRVLVEHHAQEILLQAIPAFSSMIAREPRLAANLSQLSEADRAELDWLVDAFGGYLSATQLGYLERNGIGRSDTSNAMGFGRHPSSPPLSKRMRELLSGRIQLSPLDHIERWGRLLHQIGIAAMYVLVDGVDELEDTADDPAICLSLLRPLLANLRLMDGTPYVALKFFLPQMLWPLVAADNAIRKDRGFVVAQIDWRDMDLIEILRRRLDAVRLPERGQTITGFDALCVPELRGQIEQELVRLARGNPRHLLLLCGLMVSAHCAGEPPEQDDPYQLNRHDLERAVARFEATIAPTTRDADQQVSLSILDLIAQGESEQVEFKARMRFDVKTGSVNRKLQHKIAQSVAGLMNRDGGVLLIGIDDDGHLVGIDGEVLLLAKSTPDRFLLDLMDVLEERLGPENMHLLHVRFHLVEGKTLCVVYITKSDRPIFARVEGQSEFWLRTGNKTRQLDAREAQDYIKSHWGSGA